MCGKCFEKKRKSQKNMQKKHQPIFDPSQRYPDSKNLSQYPKICMNNIGFSNRAKTFTKPFDLNVDSPLSKPVQNQCFSFPFFRIFRPVKELSTSHFNFFFIFLSVIQFIFSFGRADLPSPGPDIVR